MRAWLMFGSATEERLSPAQPRDDVLKVRSDMRWKIYTIQEADARLRALLARDPAERSRELWLAEAWSRLAKHAVDAERPVG